MFCMLNEKLNTNKLLKKNTNQIVFFGILKGVTVSCNLDTAACTILCKTSSSHVTSCIEKKSINE